jgi:hypothetical protein
MKELLPMGNRTSRIVGRVGAMFAVLLLSLTMLGHIAAGQAATPIASPVASPVAIGDPVEAAASWLVAQQLEDGSFAGFSGVADPGTTTDSLIALAAASKEGIAVEHSIEGALTYLYANGSAYAAKGAGQAAKLVIAIEAAGGDVTKVAGGNPADLVTGATAGANGVYGTGIFDHAYVILALVASDETVPQTAIAALTSTQIADGSWGFDGKTTDGNGDTNTTALVIQALVAAAQGDNPIVARGLAYLKSTQTANGSFPFQGAAGAIGDANSSASVVQAIVATGGDPASADWHDAQGALEAFQNADGAFRYQDAPPDDNLFATVQALPAVAGYDLGTLLTRDDEATPIAA